MIRKDENGQIWISRDDHAYRFIEGIIIGMILAGDIAYLVWLHGVH